MKEIMFLRHGHPYRPPDRYAHDNKIFLSEKGKSQAERVKPSVQEFNPHIIFSSPLPRALETAEIVNLELKKEIIQEPSLRERSFSALFDMLKSDIKIQYGEEFWERVRRGSEYVDMEGEETLLEAAHRVVTFLNICIESPHERILLVSHGGPHSWLCCHLLGISHSNLRRFRLGEACFSKFSFENKEFNQIEALNFCNEHLPC